MSSSESEDDCYNFAAKLNSLKNQYKDDKIETTNLLDDSTEVEEMVKKHEENIKNFIKPAPTTSLYSAGSSVSDDLDVSDELLSETLGKRVTRSRARKSKTATETVETPPPVAPKRRKKNTPAPQPSQPTIAPQPSQPTLDDLIDQFLRPVQRNARGRGNRRSRGRGRRNVSIAEAMSAVYSIGDADEPYDRSAGQQLFGNTKKDDVVVIQEEDPLDENEELQVKVYWQSCDVFKFKIRRFQKITQVFEYFANKNNVGFDNLYFTYNDSILKADDTPDSIGYSIAKFIDGGIVKQSISNIRTENDHITDGIRLKFQCQNLKKPFEITVRPNDKFTLAMMKCAEHIEIPLGKLRFELDGDSIAAQNTIQELELETGDCIDVKVLS